MRGLRLPAILALCAMAALSVGAARAGSAPVVLEQVPDWPRLLADAVMGQPVGVGVDSHNHVFVFHRADRTWADYGTITTAPIALPAVFMFDGRTGKLLAKWGEGRFGMPHGLSVDAHDHVWITDVGLEQVMEFTHDGKLLRAWGEPRVTGDDAGHFGRPTDVDFAGKRVFVSDGYLNSRVAEFLRGGKLVRAHGTKGTGPGQVQLPHGIAVHGGRIYLADRDNARLQIWSLDGKFRDAWPREKAGRPFGVATARDGSIAVIDGGGQGQDYTAVVRLFAPDGTLLASHDVTGGKTGSMGHDIALGPDGAIYVADLNGRRVVKLVRKKGN